MSAIVPAYGPIRQLDGRREPDEQVTPEQATDPDRVSRILMKILRDVAELKRRWFPRHIDFEGLVSTGTDSAPQRFRLGHNLKADVRWWVIDTRNANTVVVTLINRAPSSDPNTLILDVYYEATLTIRVEESG